VTQWDTVVFMARRNKPYTVVPLRHGDFRDYKKMAKTTVTNRQIDMSGSRIQWKRIKQLRFKKEQPDQIYYRYAFDGDFEVSKCLHSKRGNPTPASGFDQLPRKYNDRLHVSEAKTDDII
jgi:hypothetical protein